MNAKSLNKNLKESLTYLLDDINFGIVIVDGFQEVNNDRYFGKASADILFKNKKVADMPILFMKAQDGTGSNANYSSDHVFYDGGPTGIANPEKITPRDKTGVLSEVAVPLFAATPGMDYACVSMYAGCYELLTFESGSKKIITPYGNIYTPQLDAEFLKSKVSFNEILGFEPENFEQYIEGGYQRTDPSFHYTCGVLRTSGLRFGDPHSVFVPELIGKNVEQAVGFISFKEGADNSPELMALIEQEARLPWRQF